MTPDNQIKSVKPSNRSPELLLTSSGEKVTIIDTSVVVTLPPGRKVLSTSPVNGGFRTDLQGVYNHQPPHQATCSNSLEGGSVEAYLAITARRLGLNPEKSAGLITAAKMNHAAIATESFRGLEVTAIITAGIEVNGGRAGDPASYYQESGRIEMIGGTINTILLIGADLPERTMVRTVITAAEAKTVALQQLMAQSRYSSGLATGTGTDGIAIIADTTSPLHLTDAGKHAKLGELIGTVIIKATTEALDRQSRLNRITQQDIMIRIGRYSVTEEELWTKSTIMEGENRRSAFTDALREMAHEPALVAVTTAILHIQDEVSWGLLPAPAGQEAACSMLESTPALAGLEVGENLVSLLNPLESVIWNLTTAIAWIAKNRSLICS